MDFDKNLEPKNYTDKTLTLLTANFSSHTTSLSIETTCEEMKQSCSLHTNKARRFYPDNILARKF
jgi:hypothetical protein